MTIDELHDAMITRFEKVDSEFAKVNAEFAKVNREFAKVNGEFAKVDSEFAKIRADMKTESEATRRHFDVMTEKMHDSVKVVAEATVHHTSRLDNHEKRIKRLETRRRT